MSTEQPGPVSLPAYESSVLRQLRRVRSKEGAELAGNLSGGSNLENTFSPDRFIPRGINEIFYTRNLKVSPARNGDMEE